MATNNLLEPGEQFVLMVAFPRDDTKEGNGMPNTALIPNTRFSVNLQPAIGAAFPIKKTVPSSIRKSTSSNSEHPTNPLVPPGNRCDHRSG